MPVHACSIREFAKHRIRVGRRIASPILGVLILCASPAFPQRAGEVIPFGGVTNNGGSHPVYGLGVSVLLLHKLAAEVDFFSVSLDRDLLRPSSFPVSPAIAVRNAHAFGMEAGPQWMLRSPRKRLSPFVDARFGALHSSAAFRSETFAGTYTVERSSNDFLFSLGGGVRLRAGRNWGLLPEIRVFPVGRTFLRLSIGLFFRAP